MGSKPTVTLEFSGDADKLTREMDRVNRSAKDMSDKVSTSSDAMSSKTRESSGAMRTAIATGAGAIAGGAVLGIKSLMDLSKSLEAMDVKAKTVFEGQTPVIQKWAEENRRAFGASSREVVGMAASMADLLKPMGFTTKQATDMSMKMIDLSGALSRWSGGKKSAAEVSDILSDAMLGETDALKGLGISIGAADIDARLAAKGQDKLTGAARQQAEAIAVQQLIMEKSTDAQKAWAEGGRAAAEAQNGLKSTMAESAEKLAEIVAPVFERIVQILASMVDWIRQNQEAAIIIGVVTAAVWLLNAALEANPLVLIASLVIALVTAFAVLWSQSAEFRDFFIGVWNGIRDVVGAVVNWIIGAWNGVVGFFDALPGRIGSALGSIGNFFRDAFRGAANVAIDVVNWMIRRINDLIYGINVINPFEDIPYINQLQRLHTGGVVPGMAGEERMMILQAGERVVPKGQGGGAGGGGVTVRFAGDADGAFATAFANLVRTGVIQLETG